MQKKSENLADPAEIKKELEALAGHGIDVAAEQLIKLWFPVGSYDYTDGIASWRSIFFPGKRCDRATLLDVSGTSFTGADGKRVLLLSDVVCFPVVRSLAEPINVLATPRSASPFFLTAGHSLIYTNGFATDVQITIYAWDAAGAPAPNVSFDWRCRVVSVQIIL